MEKGRFLPILMRIIAWGMVCTLLYSGLAAAAADGLAVVNYSIVSSVRFDRFSYDYTYYADVRNAGSDYVNVIGTLASTNPNTTVLRGASLTFGTVNAGATVRSPSTFVVRHDRRFPFDTSAFVWTLSADPVKKLSAKFRVVPSTGNAPLAVTLIPEPITNSAIELYEWDRDGNGSFEASDTVGYNQSFTYTQPGAYPAKLRIRDSKGVQDTQTVTVQVNNLPPIITAQVNPSSGEAPLTVSFSGSATDNEGIASYEWDFQGDGVYDFTSTTTASTSFTYNTVGTYNPVLRVTDRLGVSAPYRVPSTVVQAAPVGALLVAGSVNPTAGSTPLTVSFSASTTNANGRTLSFQWDFNGDGTFDYTGTTATTSYTYTAAGTYFPKVRVTAGAEQAEHTLKVVVTASINLSRDKNTIDGLLGETAVVSTQLGGDTRVSLVIENAGGQVVRTLVPWGLRTAGTYSDSWNGRGADNNVVAEGPYYAVLLYQQDSVEKWLDLRLTTGGQQTNPPRSSIPSRFSPLAGQPLNIDFTLSQASEVTAFIGRFNVNTRLITFLQREPLGQGTHRIVWNGESSDGQLIHPPPGDSFLFGIFAYSMPNNAIYVRSGAHVSQLTLASAVFDPTGIQNDQGAPNVSVLSFSLSAPATVDLVVSDAKTGKVVAQRIYPGIGSGTQTVTWNGKDNNGNYVAPGRYLLGLAAVDAHGYKSLRVYATQRVYY